MELELHNFLIGAKLEYAGGVLLQHAGMAHPDPALSSSSGVNNPHIHQASSLTCIEPLSSTLSLSCWLSSFCWLSCGI